MWQNREKAADNYLNNAGPIQRYNGKRDPALVALTISKRLIALVKFRNVFNIEAALEMIALAMSISSEVVYFIFIFKLADWFPR